MLDVKVLGPGCAKCYALERAARGALEQFLQEQPGLPVAFEHIEDILAIEQYPVLFTPALVINDKVVCAGRVPKREEILAWYRQAVNARGGN
ncbi:MAG: thioredoxin family protein [Thermanaerothrix sp.]|uniref:Thioredoxin family protein n=1 Tax=Thermanaerothrix solaris TaxID=3058434 RepID=A0ABU3NML5_9CHLR|nr:thioredoxin family protein [Thermanaerothrix sp. 4228-RoL]MDT8898072.1 thioredoxin family protein [Thermanaerothrix sp. 4228-RoL]